MIQSLKSISVVVPLFIVSLFCNLVFSAESPDFDVELFTTEVSGLGELIIPELAGWKLAERSKPGSKIKVINAERFDPTDPVSVSFTIMARMEKEKLPPQTTISRVESMAAPLVSGSVEQQTNLDIFKTDIGTAIYASFTDKFLANQPLAAGDFRHITVGMVHHSRITISFSILSNSFESRGFRDVKLMIKHIQVLLAGQGS